MRTGRSGPAELPDAGSRAPEPAEPSRTQPAASPACAAAPVGSECACAPATARAWSLSSHRPAARQFLPRSPPGLAQLGSAPACGMSRRRHSDENDGECPRPDRRGRAHAGAEVSGTQGKGWEAPPQHTHPGSVWGTRQAERECGRATSKKPPAVPLPNSFSGWPRGPLGL